MITIFKNFIIEHIIEDSETGEIYWGNIAAGILPVCTLTKRILLNYRSSAVMEPHTYGTWGGKLEDVQVDVEDTARREFEEESGYYGNIITIPVFVFKSTDGRFEYHNFIGLVDEEFEPELNRESEGYKWVTLKQLIKMPKKHKGIISLLEDEKTVNILKKYCE